MFLLFASMALAASPVKVDSGLITGGVGDDPSVRVYKGIPFAAPPVGNLRWKPPVPVAPWQGVKTADQFSPSCMQRIVNEFGPWTYEFMTHTQVSEDCLYINVWTATKSAKEKRPVLVWIYGGGYNSGSGAVPLYDGEALAKKGIVVVNMNYRVNIFGFFTHPELTRESGRNSSGNYGLLDQIAALQWVQRNIAAFGGDPKRVTIAGQSAGAGSVLALLSSPLAKGLFHGAIAQSGSRAARGGRTLAEAEPDGVKTAEALGKKSLAELRAVSAADLAAAPSMRWAPVVDGWVVPDTIDRVIASGRFNDVPLMTGWTSDEGSSSATYGKVSAEEYKKEALQRFGDADAARYLQLYPPDAQKDSARDFTLVGSHSFGVLHAKASSKPLFLYYWTHPMPGPDKARYGAFHSSELPYVFNSQAKAPMRPWEAVDRQIADRVSSYWVNFTRSGDPNGPGLPRWAPMRPQAKVVMELGERFGERPIADVEKVALLESYFTHLP